MSTTTDAEGEMEKEISPHHPWRFHDQAAKEDRKSIRSDIHTITHRMSFCFVSLKNQKSS